LRAPEPAFNADGLPNMLEHLFGELDPDTGIYAKLGQHAERDRACSSMCSFIWLLRNDRARFTAPQPNALRMHTDLWADLQEFVKWADLDESEAHAMLVFLVIRGLCKLPSFLKAMPADQRSQEAVVQKLLGRMSDEVPCKTLLSDEQIDLIERSVTMHRAFNLAQFLQGENTPYQVVELHEFAEEYGTKVFKFSLFALVAFMCGIRGAEAPSGSLIMDQAMASGVMEAIRVLRELGKSDPIVIYWGYITARASRLGLSFNDDEDLAVARLACLIRASPESVEDLSTAWRSLSRYERQALTKHFLAGGDHEAAYFFTFLPLYLTNAQNNAAVGLSRALLVLIDILELLEVGAYKDTINMHTITVNLQDLGPFTKEVVNTRAFMCASEHSTITRRGAELVLTISTKHKQSASEAFSVGANFESTQTALRRLNRAIGAMAETLEIDSSSTPSVTHVMHRSVMRGVCGRGSDVLDHLILPDGTVVRDNAKKAACVIASAIAKLLYPFC